jgi:penicillin-binding protein 1A
MGNKQKLSRKEITFLKKTKKAIIRIFLVLLALALMGILFLVVLSEGLPSLSELEQYNPETVTKIMSADGYLIDELYIENRDVITIGQVPQNLINALISMEDHRFYEHSGISLRGLFRAAIVDILTMSRKQGASTITQQVARNMYDQIGFDKTVIRKLKEFLTAIQIEKTYTKSEIMELYLNSVYFGKKRFGRNRALYGIQKASHGYFGKNVEALTLNESATIIGLLPAPNFYSPLTHPDRALVRRDLVLSVMNKRGYISDSQYQNTISLSLAENHSIEEHGKAPYFTEYIRRELEKIDSELGINLYKDGLVIHTTLDMEIQLELEKSFLSGMQKNQDAFIDSILAKKQKFEKAIQKLDIDADSVKKVLLDTLAIPHALRNQFLVQGAAVVINPLNGHILGMIGGRQEDEYVDHFNRSIQAKRQPGSIFKPFIYLTAIKKGYTPITRVLNQPLVVFLDDTTQWNPQNHDGSTGLLTTLRCGLKKSLNLISVRVVQELTGSKDVRKTAKSFGLTTPIKAVDAIALGVSDVIPLEITSAYSAIANNGIHTQPFGITRIEDRYGRVIKEFLPKSKEIAEENQIYLLRDMMRSVVDAGTGGALRWRYKFRRPAAGKTGTTNGKTDAWFVGFTPQIAMGVWVGLDDPAVPIGLYGSEAALPIWARAIKGIYKVKDYPPQDWDRPTGIEELRICTESYKLATEWCPEGLVEKEIFLSTSKPKENCDLHSNPFSRFKGKY